MDVAEGECSIDGSSSAALSSENFPHFACWSCFACKKLNIISNSEAFGRVVKIRDPKTFLAWPVHLYPNGLKLLVSAGPSKCLGHFPQVPWKSWKIGSVHCSERRDVLENTPPKERDFPKAEILHPELLEIARGQSLGVFPCTLPREQGVYWIMWSLKIISLNMPSLLPGISRNTPTQCGKYWQC